MFIFANGDVHFCDYLGRPIGNIHKNSLSEIYYGLMAGGQRKEMHPLQHRSYQARRANGRFR